MKHICPVCGYAELNEAPFIKSDPLNSPSMDFCPSCHFQFGVTDFDNHYSYKQWREKWIKDGMPWRGMGRAQPNGWNPVKQLQNTSELIDNIHETEINKLLAKRGKSRPL